MLLTGPGEPSSYGLGWGVATGQVESLSQPKTLGTKAAAGAASPLWVGRFSPVPLYLGCPLQVQVPGTPATLLPARGAPRGPAWGLHLALGR